MGGNRRVRISADGPARRGRAVGVLVVAVIATAALVGGCGNGSAPDLVAQDRVVALSNRLDAVRAEYAVAQHQLAAARRAVARVRSGKVAATRAFPRTTRLAGRVLPPIDLSRIGLCAPIKSRAAPGAQRREMRAFALRRRHALYNLNLSCHAE
jgi:hypothetical protein